MANNEPSKVGPAVATDASVTSNAGSPVTLGDSLFSMRKFRAELDLPIVYCDNYNIWLAGLEMTHHFDTKKYGKLALELIRLFKDTPFSRATLATEPQAEEDKGLVKPRKLRFLAPNRFINRTELEIHHTADYVDEIHTEKSSVARITEIWLLNLVPLSTLEYRIIEPIKWQVAGSIYAAHLAMQHGWALNLGGGFHQASSDMGETFCLFSDIFLAIKYIWRKHPLQRFMVIDLDAHQGTGLGRDLANLEPKKRGMVCLVDIFNSTVHPPDPRADQGTNVRVDLARFTGDETYLTKLQESLTTAFSKFKPNLIFYVAGQDVLKDDQLGLLNVSDAAMIKRDELVFSFATERHRCPIVMLLGGGYLSRGINVFAESVKNLYNKNLIWGGHRSGSRSLSRPRQRGPVDVTRTATTTSSSRQHRGTQADKSSHKPRKPRGS